MAAIGARTKRAAAARGARTRIAARPRPAAAPALAGRLRAGAAPALAAKFCAAIGLALAAAPAALAAQGGAADEAAYLRAVGEHFDVPPGEITVLSRWSLSVGEIPVVLFLARRAGVSPDVVVARRSRGEAWLAVAGGYSVHAGDFHVPIAGPPGVLAAAYDRFGSRAASEWRHIDLSDDEVVGLVNVRFISQFLAVAPDRAVGELGGAGGVVGAFRRLGGG